MGSGPSIQTPHCSCSHGEDNLSYSVYEAAKKGLTKTVNSYLSQGGDVNATYKGETMLHAACSEGRENVLIMLLNQKKLCVNLRNRYNDTALMLAAQAGYNECVELLLLSNLRCPLEIHCKNNDGQRAIDIAHIKNHQEVAYCMTSFLNSKPPNEEKTKSHRTTK